MNHVESDFTKRMLSLDGLQRLRITTKVYFIQMATTAFQTLRPVLILRAFLGCVNF